MPCRLNEAMRNLVALVAFGLVACSQTTGAPVARVTPPASAPGTVTPAPATPADHVDFACRLPVITSSQSGNDPDHFRGGFISFPRAVFTADPKGVVTIGTDGELVTTATPVLHSSTGPPFYDLAEHRWVPASSSQSTPDGAFYAYTTNDPSTGVSEVHIVDVGRGVERILKVTMPAGMMGFSVADFTASGVYLLGAFTIEQLPAGVWLMDAATGSVRQLVNIGTVEAVRNGYAWAAAIDPRDSAPPQLRRSGTPSDSLVRVDLSTGATLVWFYRPGLQVQLAGFDASGAPVVQVSDPSGVSTRQETWLASSGTASTLVYAGSLFLASPQGDGKRLWLSGIDANGTSALYLYTAAHGLQEVYASTTPQLAIEPGGRCT